MGKRIFTDESLATFVDEIKAYTDEAAGAKVDKVSGKGLSTNDYTTSEKTKLSGIATGAEVNQNAFSNVTVGSTTIAADSKTDTLTIAAGTGISVSGDATNDKVTITNSGVRSIATGGSNGTISVNTNGTSANVAVKGLGSAAYTASTAYDASGTAQTKANAALASAKTYTDTAISNLINGAPTTLDTLGEIATAMAENEDVVEALEDAIGTKANKSELNNYVSKSSTAVQPIMGGLVVGGGSATATGPGRIMITGVGNPLIGLQALDSEGKQLTPYYFQVSNDVMYLGPTSSKALAFDRDGNVYTPNDLSVMVDLSVGGGAAVVGDLSVEGTIIEGGEALPDKYAGAGHTHTVSHTPAGTVSKPSFTGSAVTSGSPSASSTVASSTHTHEYTPAGTVSKPSFTGSAVTSGKPDTTNVTTIYSITGVGTLPSHSYTAPSFSGSATNRCLTLSFSAGSHSFSAGSLPSRSSAISMPNTNHTHSVTASGSVSQPTFTGTKASTTSISGTTSVASSGHTHSVTAAGAVSQPTFTGTAATLTSSTPK